MDISFNVEKLAEAFKGKRRDDLEAVIGKAFIDCLEKAYLYFRGSMDVNATEYMLGEIANVDEDGARHPDLSAWTSKGKTHDQMLKEKMAMHNGFPMPENPPKRRGRPPKAKEEA